MWPVRPIVHKNPSRKPSERLKALFEPDAFKHNDFRFHVGGKHFESGPFWEHWPDNIHVSDYPAQVFLKHKSRDRCLLRFQIPPTWCGWKTFDTFSEWNLRFQLTPWSVNGASVQGKKTKFFHVRELSVLKITAVKMGFQSFNIRVSICYNTLMHTTKCIE